MDPIIPLDPSLATSQPLNIPRICSDPLTLCPVLAIVKLLINPIANSLG